MSVRPGFDAYYNDWGGGATIRGWVVARPADEIEDITIEARLEGTTIGYSVLSPREPGGRSRFVIACRERFRPVDIITGRLKLHAARPGSEETEVRADHTLMTWMAKVTFNENVFDHIRDPESAKFILERIETRFGPDLINGRMVETPAEKAVDAERDLTALLARTGTISTDRSAILGREGRIFLYEGSNRLFTQYQQHALDAPGAALAAQWEEVIRNRVAFFRDLGIPFTQIIIPEKSSVLDHLFPLPIRTPTRLLAAVESRVADTISGCGTGFVSGLDAFRGAPDADRFYLKTDSHFAASGALATTRLLLAALAGQHATVREAMPALEALFERAGSPSIPHRLLTGDLATRFFGVPLYEQDLDIRYEDLFEGPSSVKLVHTEPPPAGNLNGLRMEWFHADAPLDLRVVAFGNSFFERGADCTSLSWWFKHLCRNFHLAWSKDVDREYVERVKPDLVICQTIERFLTVVPAF